MAPEASGLFFFLRVIPVYFDVAIVIDDVDGTGNE